MKLLSAGSMGRAAILCSFLLAGGLSAQEITPTPTPDLSSVSVLFVMVDDHEFGDVPAVLKVFHEHPLLRNVIIVRRQGLSPRLLQQAMTDLLHLMDSGALQNMERDVVATVEYTGSSRAIGTGPPSQWAVRAFQRLVSSPIVQVPEFGMVKAASLGVAAGILRQDAVERRRPNGKGPAGG